MKMHRGARAGLAAVAAAAVVVLAGCSSAPVPLVPTHSADTGALREAVDARNIMDHLEALQDVADANGGNRAAGTSGYEESARYVEEQLRAAGYDPVRQHFSYRDDGEEIETFNVLAETGGSDEHIIVAGGHLDSVRRGPGINDNASGVAAILETALRMADSGIEPTNRVRFAFWGGEEEGLYGSEHYVDELSGSETGQHAVYLNLDMVASPNGVRFVHDGDGSTFGDNAPNGSDEIEDVFLDYFADRGLEAAPTPFLDGDSDYTAFLRAGIPSGGLFTGDAGTKSGAEAQDFGGQAGVVYDSCYHESCDTIENVDTDVLEELADALAHTTIAFATATPAED
jgi:aminopeptidase S